MFVPRFPSWRGFWWAAIGNPSTQRHSASLYACSNPLCIRLCVKTNWVSTKSFKLPEAANSQGTVKLSSSFGRIKVTQGPCAFTFWKSMKLPCRHILSLGRLHRVGIFDACLPWTSKKYSADFRLTLQRPVGHITQWSLAIIISLVHSSIELQL